MTFAPQTLKDLAAMWVAHGGVNQGIVGDAGHVARGVSYHLGADQLDDDAYSAKLPRDVAGLSNAASAIDLGELYGSLSELQAFSRYLVQWCLAGMPGSRDIREIIYTPDGGLPIHRYSSVDNQVYTGPGSGSDSHLTHTHISYWRDSEFRDKRGPFIHYFATVNPPDTGTGDDMPPPIIIESLFGYRAEIGGPTAAHQPTSVRELPSFGATVLRTVTAREPYGGLVGWAAGEPDPANNNDSRWLERVRPDGVREYVPHGDIPSLAAPPPDTSTGWSLATTSSPDGQTVTVTIKGG